MAHNEPAPDSHDEALLVLAADGDPARLAALRERVGAGEPAAYVAGFFLFRDHRFAIDPRAYITDPEVTHLVDQVNNEGRALEQTLGRPPSILEFGVGAGAMAISVKRENPRWTVAGLDVDAAALELARANARSHGVNVSLLESDFFSAWPTDAAPPDLIFGDPPWGGAEDLYTDARDADYYRQMPARSAFPPCGNRTALHDEIIARLVALRWPSLLILNYGVLPTAVIELSAQPLRTWHVVHPQPHLSVLIGRAC